MKNLVLSRTQFGPIWRGSHVGLLVRLNNAYKNSRKFKALPKERLTDMGLTTSDQATARFGAFFEKA